MASHRTVLLVEDNPHRLDALGAAFRRHGYHVLTATDGHRAAELMARGLPDVAVVGMLLPGQSGFQVAALAKAWSNGRLPVVMLADIAADAHRDYALAVGADVFLARPVSPEGVCEAVEALCPRPTQARRPGSGTTSRPAPTSG
jgi:DNA-binding response OmpR family regulator